MVAVMTLTDDDFALIEKAKALVGEKKVSCGIIKEVGCALITNDGQIFTGASMDLGCGLGFCAEHTAIANMISHSNETEIQTIVAVGEVGILPPCGRCRELMQVIDKINRNTEVIVSDTEKKTLAELLPDSWME